MNIINVASFSTIALYNNDEEKPYQSLLDLSKFYMSFMELKLAFNLLLMLKIIRNIELILVF